MEAPATPINESERIALDFLQKILPSGDYTYGASSIRVSKWKDYAHKDILTIVRRCLELSPRNNDTYIALSAFRQGWHTTDDGKVKFRTHTNAVAQRSLWLDVDCGEDKFYKSQTQAIQALSVFLQQTQMPLPDVVFSGSGLHLYWSFVETTETRDWLCLAEMLKGITNHFNFAADHSRTTDPSSVLRLPGTLNYGRNKDNVIRPVEWKIKAEPNNVIEFATNLIRCIKENNISLTNHPVPVNPGMSTPPSIPQLPDKVWAGFTGMSDFQDTPRHPYRIIVECKQIQQAGVYSQKPWGMARFNTALVMSHCAFGKETIHAVCKMNPNYDEDLTEYYINYIKDNNYGPALCESFNKNDPGICSGCPYYGKISTPLLLGETYQEPRAVSMPAPAIDINTGHAVVDINAPKMEVVPYTSKEFSVRPGVGIIWHKRELTSGELVDPEEDTKQYITKDILICDTEIYIHSICIDNTSSDIKRSYVIRKIPRERVAEDILYSIENAFGTIQTKKWLAQNGMLPIKPKYDKQMSDFMNTYLAAVQNRLPEIYIREHYGWISNTDRTTGEKYDGFIVGNTMYSDKGSTAIKLTDRAEQMSIPFRSQGTLEEWKKIPQMYRVLNQPFAMSMMLSGFSALFMKYGLDTATNIAYNFFEPVGGKGKTTVLRAINSIWGHPDLLMMTRRDTHASRYQYFSVYRNLPVCTDEITNMTDNEVADMLFDITTGRERNKSTSTGNNVLRTGGWNTSALFTSNRSVYEMMRNRNEQGTATSMRIIESRCDFIDYTQTQWNTYVSDTLQLINNNFGVAGPTFLNAIFSTPGVVQYIIDTANHYVKLFKKNSDERFWVQSLAYNLAVNNVCVAIGLLDYDTDYLFDYYQNTLLPEMRERVKSLLPNGQNMLADYFNDTWANTLTVTAARRTPKQQDPGYPSMTDTFVRHMPIAKLYNRIEQDTMTAYVSHKALVEWHRERNYSLEFTLTDLANHGGWKRGDKFQYSLGVGVMALERGRSVVYKIDLKSLMKTYDQMKDALK